MRAPKVTRNSAFCKKKTKVEEKKNQVMELVVGAFCEMLMLLFVLLNNFSWMLKSDKCLFYVHCALCTVHSRILLGKNSLLEHVL